MIWTPWIKIEDEATPDKVVQELYRHTRDKMTNKVPDMIKLTGSTSEVAARLHDLRTAIGKNKSGLTLKEEELAALIVAVFNGCVH